MGRNQYATIMVGMYMWFAPGLLLAPFFDDGEDGYLFVLAYLLMFAMAALGLWANLRRRKERNKLADIRPAFEPRFDHSFSPGPGRIVLLLLALGFSGWFINVTWLPVAAYLLSLPLLVLAIFWNPHIGNQQRE